MLLCRPAVRSQARSLMMMRRNQFATSAAKVDTAALPLAGVRVLDMTRVLAGVSLMNFKIKNKSNPDNQ